jgi:hypothetical protein
MAWTNLNFRGNVSDLFYVMEQTGSEVVPINLIDSTVTIDDGTLSPTGQTLTYDGGWYTWIPANGPLSIAFSDGLPVRTLWVVTTQAPTTIPVWATSAEFTVWKQPTPTVTPAPSGFYLQENTTSVNVASDGLLSVDIANGVKMTVSGTSSIDISAGEFLAESSAVVTIGGTSLIDIANATVTVQNMGSLITSGSTTFDIDVTGSTTTINGGTLNLSNSVLTIGNATPVTHGNLSIPSTGSLMVSDSIVELPAGALTITPTLTISNATISSTDGAVLAYFGYSETGPLTVTFTDKSYSDGSQGSVTSWLWNFGDSMTSTAQNPVHTYTLSNPGYTVELTSTTSGGYSSTCTISVAVS